MPKISIIMPNYNGDKFIEEAIRAFISSSWKNKELVIVDGKSTDSSHSIIASFVSLNDNIKWVNKSDSGISDAINIGIESSSGDVIGYLGCDDLLIFDTLEKVANYKKIIDFDGVYFDSYTFDCKTNSTKYRECPNVKFNMLNLLRFGTIVGLQNMFFSARVFENFKYDTTNKYSMDYEIYLRIVMYYSNFIHIKQPSSINIAHDNITNKFADKQRDESYEVANRYAGKAFTLGWFYVNKRKFFDLLRSYL
ncbi:MAG: glycosyltransferase [Shewanella sp.]